MMEDQEKGAGFSQEQLKSLEAIVQSVVERSLKEHGSAAGAEPRDTPATSGTGAASGKPARKGGLGGEGVGSCTVEGRPESVYPWRSRRALNPFPPLRPRERQAGRRAWVSRAAEEL